MAEASAFFPRSCDGGSSLSIASPVGAADRREGDGSSKGRRCQRPLDKRRCRREMAAATCGELQYTVQIYKCRAVLPICALFGACFILAILYMIACVL